MVQKSGAWFLRVVIGSLVLAAVMVGVMEWLQHIRLPWWLHIPFTVIVLTGMGGGALAAGMAYVEYGARKADQARK